jgi:hypothetical protein
MIVLSMKFGMPFEKLIESSFGLSCSLVFVVIGILSNEI